MFTGLPLIVRLVANGSFLVAQHLSPSGKQSVQRKAISGGTERLERKQLYQQRTSLRKWLVSPCRVGPKTIAICRFEKLLGRTLWKMRHKWEFPGNATFVFFIHSYRVEKVFSDLSCCYTCRRCYTWVSYKEYMHMMLRPAPRAKMAR